MTAGGVKAATARLRLLKSLPRQHQAYFFKRIRELCMEYIVAASRRDSSIDCHQEAEELRSEVFFKLFGSSDIVVEHDFGIISKKIPTAISDDPGQDERVIWLILQVGGPGALKHRHEDIRRRNRGGKWRDEGYRQVQLEMAHIAGLSVEPDDPYHEIYLRMVWRGLLKTAVSQFRPGVDVLLLLDVMAHDPEVRAGFGAEWPVSQIVSALNQINPVPPWNDDRVDNAKKRLKNWIVRLKRIYGLDTDGLKDLFARRGREAGAFVGTSHLQDAPSPFG
jgi:hypothetical protein